MGMERRGGGTESVIFRHSSIDARGSESPVCTLSFGDLLHVYRASYGTVLLQKTKRRSRVLSKFSQVDNQGCESPSA